MNGNSSIKTNAILPNNQLLIKNLPAAGPSCYRHPASFKIFKNAKLWGSLVNTSSNSFTLEES